MNRQAEVTEMLTVIFWLFVVGVGVMALMLATSNLFPILADSPLGDDNATLAAINSAANYTSTGPPAAFLIIFFGLMAGVMVSSFFVTTHPIFIPVYILFCIVSLIAVPGIGNAWGNMKDIPEIAALVSLNQFTILMDTILSNLVLVSLGVFILSFVIIFAKPRAGGGGGGGPS